jgi:hypothetical protein
MFDYFHITCNASDNFRDINISRFAGHLACHEYRAVAASNINCDACVVVLR